MENKVTVYKISPNSYQQYIFIDTENLPITAVIQRMRDYFHNHWLVPVKIDPEYKEFPVYLVFED